MELSPSEVLPLCASLSGAPPGVRSPQTRHSWVDMRRRSDSQQEGRSRGPRGQAGAGAGVRAAGAVRGLCPVGTGKGKVQVR